MAKFKYVGDPNDRFSGPDVSVSQGFTFRKGDAVDVPDTKENEAAIFKLRGNSHFLDLSDKDEVKDIEERKRALEKAEQDRAKSAELQRKADEKDAAEMAKRQAANPGPSPAASAPRPPGTVTREPPGEPFQGRTVEQRTRAEDHTSAGKTKG